MRNRQKIQVAYLGKVVGSEKAKPLNSKRNKEGTGRKEGEEGDAMMEDNRKKKGPNLHANQPWIEYGGFRTPRKNQGQ